MKGNNKAHNYKNMEAMNYDTFRALGTYLLDMRCLRGYSMSGLSAKIGVSAATLRLIEHGGAPSILVLFGYVRYTGAERAVIERILKGEHSVYACPRLRLYADMDATEQAAVDGVRAGLYGNVIEAQLVENAKRGGGNTPSPD